MNTNEEPTPSLILSIMPEPTTDERDAIVAALVVLRRRRAGPSRQTDTVTPTRWQRTARREAVRAGTQVQGWR